MQNQLNQSNQWSHKRDFLFKFVPPASRSLLRLDEEAAYSVTDMYTADKMTRDIMRYAQITSNSVICDATACIGGNTASFARAFKHVVAIERDVVRYEHLVHNMGVLKAHNVKCVCGDALEEVTWVHHSGAGYGTAYGALYDVIFIDPPWGGPEYKQQNTLGLELSGVPLQEVCKRWAKYTKFFALKTPTNFDELSFTQETADFLELKHKNTLRKVTMYVFECIRS